MRKKFIGYVTKKFRARPASDTTASRGIGDAFRMWDVSFSQLCFALVGCICRQAVLHGGIVWPQLLRADIPLAQPPRDNNVFYSTEWGSVGFDQFMCPPRINVARGLGSSDGQAWPRSLTLGMGSAHLTQADQGQGDTPGKIRVRAMSCKCSIFHRYPQKLTRTCSEPGLKPRNEAVTFLPLGRRGRYK